MPSNNWRKGLVASVILVLLVIGGYLAYDKYYTQKVGSKILAEGDFKLQQFKNETEFNQFLNDNTNNSYQSTNTLGRSSISSKSNEFAADIATPSMSAAGDSSTRYSETNVQVVGLDEPDVVKTDGKNIYYSKEQDQRIYDYNSSMPISPDAIPLYKPTEVAKINIIEADPVKLAILSKIDKQGQILLSGKYMAIFANDGIYSYDLSTIDSPKEIWSYKYGENSHYVTARLIDGQIYLVLQTYIYRGGSSPCPIRPLTDSKLTVGCADIYYPNYPISADSTYHFAALDFASGEVKKQSSFVGSASNTIVYVSPENIYLAYQTDVDQATLMIAFYKENKNLLTNELMAKVDKLDQYDISNQAKLTELNQIYESYLAALKQDEQEEKQIAYANALEKFAEAHARELSYTGIAKVKVDSLELVTTGKISGHLLNQFSMDEFEGNLRIATTIGQRWGFGGKNTNANDVYVLNADLKTIGSVIDLGKEERIYSARFIKDKGYLVTFKETDPFYILDLSDPTAPKMTGELKIPGYSGYLHPVADNLILGIGKEDSKVKASLFDVSDSNNPKETSKLTLDEYWSEALSDHKAFLQDRKHEIFFIPASKGGYVISYKDSKLTVAKKIDGYSVKRALYIGDNLYILTANKIIILSETDWSEKVKLDL